MIQLGSIAGISHFAGHGETGRLEAVVQRRANNSPGAPPDIQRSFRFYSGISAARVAPASGFRCAQ